MARVARHVSVTGRVQGVFFRAWMREQAEELGVTGWVRNCPDGRVDSHIEGDESAIQQLVDLLHQGPPSAKVEDVHLWDVEPCDFDAFEVRH
jgi:acylphosphatase